MMHWRYKRRQHQINGRVIPFARTTLPLWWLVGMALAGLMGTMILMGVSREAGATESIPAELRQAAVQVVQEYSEAIASRDPVRTAQRDIVCLLRMMEVGALTPHGFPDSSDPVYSWCWRRIEQAHAEVIERRDLGLDELWPGVGKLVNFSDFKRFLIDETHSRQRAPSFFVMPQIRDLAGPPGFSLEIVSVSPLPHASFQIPGKDRVVAVPTVAVETRIAYPDPMTSPVANGPGEMDWAVPYKKPIHPIKAVKVKWVVLSGLKQHGFPTDTAVLNIPLESEKGLLIPFVVDAGGFEQGSTEYWDAKEAKDLLERGVVRAKEMKSRRDRIGMLNRVLMVNPLHLEALQAITHDLYGGLLAQAVRKHGVPLSSDILYEGFNELYWTIQSQTDRMDISLDMEMGGKTEPTPADYLYRMIPAMEKLADLQPGDFETRLRLSSAYRWTNDQVTAIMSPQQLLSEVPKDQTKLRARILLAIAWSRISKVAWNRHYDDPDIVRAFEEADEAYQLASDPLVKFSASYAKAYSLAFRPNPDHKAMLDHLAEARQWYRKIPGANNQNWAYMLQNDTLKGYVQTDPAFQSLLSLTS